jgi:hypothetical protein
VVGDEVVFIGKIAIGESWSHKIDYVQPQDLPFFIDVQQSR